MKLLQFVSFSGFIWEKMKRLTITDTKPMRQIAVGQGLYRYQDIVKINSGNFFQLFF